MSRDGIKLHGYITLPPNYKEGEKIPFIIHPHGGPNARDYWGYNLKFNFMLQEAMVYYRWIIEDQLVMEEKK